MAARERMAITRPLREVTAEKAALEAMEAFAVLEALALLGAMPQ